MSIATGNCSRFFKPCSKLLVFLLLLSTVLSYNVFLCRVQFIVLNSVVLISLPYFFLHVSEEFFFGFRFSSTLSRKLHSFLGTRLNICGQRDRVIFCVQCTLRAQVWRRANKTAPGAVLYRTVRCWKEQRYFRVLDGTWWYVEVNPSADLIWSICLLLRSVIEQFVA